MNDRHRPTCLLLTAAVLAAILGAGAPARAQDDEDDEEEAKPVVVNRFGLVANDVQFDQWVFGNMGMGNAATAREKLDSLLTLNVEDVERTCGLTPVQKKKLLLAGRGDIKRFFDRVDAVRKKFTRDRNLNLQNQFQQVWQEIQPLQAAFNAGLFGPGSIYGKAIHATLTPAQAEKHDRVEHDRLMYRYWARVDLAMELLNNEVGFTDDQRRQLVKLLHEETKPPRKLGQQDYYVVLYQLSRIPEARIKPVFEDIQWPFIKRHLDQGRGLEMFVKQQGFVPGDEADAKGRVHRPGEAKAGPRPDFKGR